MPNSVPPAKMFPDYIIMLYKATMPWGSNEFKCHDLYYKKALAIYVADKQCMGDNMKLRSITDVISNLLPIYNVAYDMI